VAEPNRSLPHRIRGALVYLRPLEPEDLETTHRWSRDADYARLIGEPPRSLAQRRRRFEEALSEHGRSLYLFAICRIEDDALIGRLDLFEIDRLNGSAAFGLGIGDRDLWGKGLGTDAVCALVDFAFGELRLERVWLGTDADNVRAHRAYEKAGFTVEARLRRAYLDRGRLLDEIRMSLLRDEWAALPRRKSWEYDQR
jgi:RimJ/RimL family protein N-acetyltransferase